MEVLVLPVSGGKFVKQLAILCDLAKHGYKPDITMGTSGGNISAYIAAGGDWEEAGIIRVARSVSSSYFLESWYSDHFKMLPSWTMGIFKGSIYRQSPNYNLILDNCFSRNTINKYEIWSGTYNEKKNCPAIFCNRDEGNTKLKVNIDPSTTLEPIIKYVNGDTKMLSSVCYASASIPSLVPYENIENEEHCDGGIFSSSPMTSLYKSFVEYKNIHITYVSPQDLRTVKTICGYTKIINKTLSAFEIFEQSQKIADRNCAISLLGPDYNFLEGCSCDAALMKKIEQLRKEADKSVVEYYCTFGESVELHTFKGPDLMDKLERCRNSYRFRAWWCGEEDLFTNVLKHRN
jgi:hypothetical protein